MSMRLRIFSKKETSHGILRAPVCSYPNSCVEASNSSASRGWLRTLASITNLIRISWPTYTGRHPLGTILRFFLPSEFCLLLLFFSILTNANGRLEVWISRSLCSKRINWRNMGDDITKKPTLGRFTRVQRYMVYSTKSLLICYKALKICERMNTGGPESNK